MKLINNYKYWVLSLLGWIFYMEANLAFAKSIVKYNEEDYTRVYYYQIEALLCGILGFLLSFILLFYIEKKFNIGKLKKTYWLYLFLIFIAVQIIYNTILWPMLSLPVKYMINEDINLNFREKYSNIIFFALAYMVWLFVVLSIKVYDYLNRIKINNLNLENTLKESQLNTLKGQINPHFMFNSLNNIRGLILEDPLQSRDMITKLSEILRYSLTNNEKNLISIEEELEIVDSFIDISKIQLEERLTYNQIVDKDLLKASIPPMLIQILVENAVKHGISNLKNGGNIELRIFKETLYLNIIVTNTGALNKSKESTKIGIKNIAKRLQLLYAKKGSFQLFEKEGNVVAHIKIPII